MYTIEVVNIRIVPSAEYVGRPSPLSNPLQIGPGHSRDEVCDYYEEVFQSAVFRQDPLVMHELKRLHRLGKAQGYLKLGCFCKPKKRCHGDTIKRWLEDNFDFMEVLDS